MPQGWDDDGNFCVASTPSISSRVLLFGVISRSKPDRSGPTPPAEIRPPGILPALYVTPESGPDVGRAENKSHFCNGSDMQE